MDKRKGLIKFEQLKIGQHLWVLSMGNLLMVAKLNHNYYDVCGAWDAGIDPEDCQIIELIPFPYGYGEHELYYSQDS